MAGLHTAKVSIIMPTYNRANYITESIESILRQTWQNWELIVVDDGSDDNTEETVNEIRDGRIKFYKLKRTAIVGKIKNFGLGKSSGELIAFLDSDDLWAPTKLEKQIEALTHYKEAGFCMTGGFTFRKANEPIDFFYKQKEGCRYDNVFISLFQSEIAAYTQALMVRRSCLDAVGNFNEAADLTMNDADFIAHLALHFKAIILYEPLVFRRLHDSNYIYSAWEKSYFEGIELIESYRKKGDLPSAVARASLYKLYINFGEACLRQGKNNKAIARFLQAWRSKPFSIVPSKKIGKAVLNMFRNSAQSRQS
jgi:glycosyltransferase involved in cell wall biosynthesis